MEAHVRIMFLICISRLQETNGDGFDLSKDSTTGQSLCRTSDDPDRTVEVRSTLECSKMCAAWPSCYEFSCWTLVNKKRYRCELFVYSEYRSYSPSANCFHFKKRMPSICLTSSMIAMNE